MPNTIINSLNLSPRSKQLLHDHFTTTKQDLNQEKIPEDVLYICYIAKYIDAFFISSLEKKEALTALCEFIIMLRTASIAVPYDFIAYFIYNSEFNHAIREADEYEQHIDLNYNGDKETYEHISKSIRRISRHISLSIQQKKYILKHISEASTLADEAKTKADDAKNIAESFLERLQGTTGAYVAILGIFTSIIIAVFGGVNLLNSALSYLKDKTNFIFFTSIGMICLLVIMQLLFTWVGHLKRELPIDKQWYSVVSPHNTFFLIIIIILTMLASCNQPNSLESTNTAVEKNRNHTPTPTFDYKSALPSQQLYIKEAD